MTTRNFNATKLLLLILQKALYIFDYLLEWLLLKEILI